jgi:glyoxylase-like metal-dependent hydrolase (beta-lactamase superfamily II)
LIDNGFNQPQARSSLLESLDALKVRLEEVDFFLTHAHADHCGLTSALCGNAGSTVWSGAEDSAIIRETMLAPQRADSFLGLNDYWDRIFLYMGKHGVPRAVLEKLALDHPAKAYSMDAPVDFSMAGEGDVLEYGRFCLRVVSVPGHSPGHMALYDEREKIFFAGDHILSNITPNIASWGKYFDYLRQYLGSLDKTARMDIALTLPGHRVVIKDTAGRIAELKKHHAGRLEEVRGILKGSARPLTAYAVAAQMRWALRYRDWEEFPAPQKWFAAGEASTHLLYLEGLGELRAEDTGELFLYSCR